MLKVIKYGLHMPREDCSKMMYLLKFNAAIKEIKTSHNCRSSVQSFRKPSRHSYLQLRTLTPGGVYLERIHLG